jgi:hypothetical protein
MSIPSRPGVPAGSTTSMRHEHGSRPEQPPDPQLCRWGGIAGLAGVVLLVGTVVVVGAFGLPDASDVETLRDFGDIETGRIFEHFSYLGALVMFALHVAVLNRLLAPAHPPAALFGAVVAEFGLVIMAAGSMLHVSTSPLSELSRDPSTPDEDQASIEYAWHGAQSVFDTLLATGLLLVPIGIVLFGLAMLRAPQFGRRLAWLAIVAGALGLFGAVIEAVDRSLEVSAVAVLAIAVFHLSTGWRTLHLARDDSSDLAATADPPG